MGRAAMRVRVLGCNGGIGGALRTTCFKVDRDILLDCGTGAGELDLEQMIAIDTVLLTHSHLDHCGFLPLLADAAGSFRDTPLRVHALPETIASIKRYILNGIIWPDYTVQPAPDRPYMRFVPLEVGDTLEISGRKFTALPTRHSVPCVGYQLDSGYASLVYSGDTTFCEEFWLLLNGIHNLKYLLIENTFLTSNDSGARVSGHMTAELLARGMRKLDRPVQLFIVHMESGHELDTMREVLRVAGDFEPTLLQRDHVFDL
jgi:ribonuclease BN (tRNA processing enzyme)